MLFRILADIVVLLHLAFVAFVVLGGLLALRNLRWAWVHIPVAVYGALIELVGWVCPLTPLEIRLRAMGGEAGYSGGFVEHYILPILYPADLTRGLQIVLGVLVVAVNLLVYSWAVWRRRRAGGNGPGSAPEKEAGPQ